MIGCPWKQVPETVPELATLYYHYKNGFLPLPGALDDQPLWFHEAILACSQIESQIQENEMESARKK